MTERLDQETSATPALPKRKMFQSKFTAVRLSADALERQSGITLLAWNVLGPDAAIAFLNSHDEALGGRPLDMAIASSEGFDKVEQVLAARRHR